MTALDGYEFSFGDFGVEHLILAFMFATSLVLVAIVLERLLFLFRVRRSLAAARRVLQPARAGNLADSRRSCDVLPGPLKVVLGVGLDRATGRVRGDPAMAMAREQKRLAGSMKARVWILGTAGALMPFVGLFGTVLGVMASFESIGDSGQGGFAVVSSGIFQALVATAAGIAVALEAVVLFNLLQSITVKLTREVALLVDELVELIAVARTENAGNSPSQ